MSDEERIAKLQKLLDRVLTRGEAEESPASEEPSNGEQTQISEGPLPDPPHEEPVVQALERSADPSDHKVLTDEPPSVPVPLESRSRLVAAQPEAEELSDDDLVPASESPDMLEAAVPLVRRSKRPTEDAATADHAHAHAHDHEHEHEPLSEGRIPLNLNDVQVQDEHEKSLAEEIAAEEVHSGELEEEAPISSRRPIDGESSARDADDESPPESGKQVSVAPYDSPPSGARKSATPPDAPDVIRPEIPPSGKVASITALPAARPATFGELIDASLDL
jgi:hypothetical protein